MVCGGFLLHKFRDGNKYWRKNDGLTTGNKICNG